MRCDFRRMDTTADSGFFRDITDLKINGKFFNHPSISNHTIQIFIEEMHRKHTVIFYCSKDIVIRVTLKLSFSTYVWISLDREIKGVDV